MRRLPTAPHILAVIPCALALLTAPRRAAADETNPGLLPMGEREAMMSNAGVTSVTAVAAFYNPGNLARLQHPSFSLSGTTILHFSLHTDTFIVTPDEDLAFDASGLLTVPASLISTYKVGRLSLATSVLVPDAFEISNRVSYEVDGSRLTILQKQRSQALWLGLSAAARLGDAWSVGLSLFGVQRSRSRLSSVSVITAGEPPTAAIDTTSSETSILGVQAVLGVSFAPSDALSLGLRVAPGLLRARGTADLYASQIRAGEVDEAIEVERSGVDVRDGSPSDISLGVALRPHPRLELALDGGVQLPQTYREYDDATLGEEVELEAAPRVALGAELAVTDGFRALLGAFYNGSASPDPVDEGDSQDDYLGVSGGVIWQSGRTRTGVGAFYHHGRGTLVPINGAGRTVGASSDVIGGLITAAYTL